MTRDERAARPFLVLQHIDCESPGSYEDVLVERGLHFVRVEVDDGGALPDWSGVAGIIAMGGPMGANDEATHSWLAPEKAYLEAAIGAGTPLWGVCLGAQLLAAALGARVAPGPSPEIGVHPVTTTEAARHDPVFRNVPPTFPAFHWHSDTFDLPAEARLLARSDAYRHQAFAVGHAYGLQFHAEITPQMARRWAEVPAYAESLAAVAGPDPVPALVRAVEGAADTLAAVARTLFSAWLDLVLTPDAEAVGARPPVSPGTPAG